MTKKKTARTAAEEARRYAWAAGMPGAIAERERALNTRLRQLSKPPEQFRICNSTMPSDSPYCTGDGETRQTERPGSQRAYTIPSRGIST